MSIRARVSRAIGIAVAGALLAAGAACADSPNDGASTASDSDSDSDGPMDVRFMQLGESMAWMPFLVARGTGCYEDAGLDVEWVNGPANGQQAALAVGQGEADVVGIGTTGFLAALGAGRPLAAFGAGAKGDTSSIVLSNGAIDRLADDGITIDSPVEERMEGLRGLTIGANTAGGPVYLATVDALHDFGLDESDVHLQALDGPAAMVSAMAAGQIDGFVYSPPAVLQPVLAGEGQIWIDGPSGDVPIWEEGYFWVYATTRSYAEQNPEVLEAIYGCVEEAAALIADDPDAAAEAAREYFPSLDDEQYDVSFDALAPVFVDGPSASEEGYRQSVDRYNASSDTPVDTSFADAFVTASP